MTKKIDKATMELAEKITKAWWEASNPLNALQKMKARLLKKNKARKRKKCSIIKVR
jgi:hypothetical protein